LMFGGQVILSDAGQTRVLKGRISRELKGHDK
jgi:hypothetical protein